MMTMEQIRELFTELMVQELLLTKNIKVSVKEMQSMIDSARRETDLQVKQTMEEK